MLLDTSGLLCLHYLAEPLHSLARNAYAQATRLFTHSYVLAEYVALAQARRCPRHSALKFLTRVTDDPAVEVIWVDEAMHKTAVALLLNR